MSFFVQWKPPVFDSFTLATTGKLTPLIIDKNCDVSLELKNGNLMASSYDGKIHIFKILENNYDKNLEFEIEAGAHIFLCNWIRK